MPQRWIRNSGDFTATALAGFKSFSDGNSRNHVRSRLVWLAAPEHGITLQLRYRRYWSHDDVEGTYFNPENYQQWLGAVAIRKRHAGWVFSGALGAGRELVTGVSAHPSYLADVRLEGAIARDIRLVLRAGHYRSAGFIESPDYAYSWLAPHWCCRFTDTGVGWVHAIQQPSFP